MKFFYNASGGSKTLLLGVKLVIALILTACLQVSARTSSAQRLSISFHNGSLDKLFAELEKKTNYVFFYDAAILKGTKLVTVEMKEASLEEILQFSLKGQALEYAIHDRTIFVKKEGKPAAVIPGGPGKGGPQSVVVVVKSEAGTPLVGASVFIKKLNKTGMTNENGEIVLQGVPSGNYELEISFIGYEKRVTKFSVEDHQARVDANMTQAINSLDETVVIPYGTTTRRLNTGDITKVKGEDIQKQPVSDPIMALEGRVPGLYIQQASGIPGAKMVVRLRGQNSIANGNDPLYIVDGVPFTSTSLTSPNIGGGAFGSPSTNPGANVASGMSPFNTLNPADIESVEVLKDADATAIYGSRGANGVILITTKKGKAGDSKFLANVYSGEGKVTRKMDLLNTQQYLQVRHQAFVNDGKTPSPTDYDINGAWDTTRYTDWQKVLFGGTAKFTNAQATLSGGNAYTQFVVGGGYSRQTTVFPGSYYDEKTSAHMNINHSSTNQKFHILANAQYGNDNNVVPQSDFTGSLNLAPDAPALYDVSGNINWQNATFNNPMAGLLKKAKAISNMLSGSMTVGYELIHGLQLKSNFGYTKMQMNQSNQQLAAAVYGPINPKNRRNSFATTNFNTWIIEPQLEYSKKISHSTLNILIGSTHQQNNQNSVAQIATGFSNDALIPSIAAATTVSISGTQASEYHYVAFFSRINYNWEEKYLINFTARRDGSSRFGPSNQFGNFGAIGAGWIFSKERFIEKGLRFLSFGKLRASYGSTGNDQIGDYQYLSTYMPYTGSTYQGISTLYPTGIANPYFGWEVVKKLEGGVELGFLKDRILFTVNYYRNRTGNQLVGQPLPSTAGGFGSIQANLPAIVQNTGTEIILTSTNIRTKDFTWTTAINLSIPRNKLVAFPGLANNPNYNLSYSVGRPLFSQPRYHYTGINKQTGLYTFEDINHDGAIDYKDVQFLKQKTQNYFGGIQNSISFKEWTIDFLLQFVKQTGSNYLANFGNPGYAFKNQPVEVLKAWHVPGDDAAIQKYTQTAGAALTAAANYAFSDAIISDASFIRLKNISVSYNLPSKWQHSMHLQNSRLYFQAQNLFTITSFRGLDPETQGLSLPPLRMITGGIQVGF